MLAAFLLIGFPRGYESYTYHLSNAVKFFSRWLAAYLGTGAYAYVPSRCEPLEWVLVAAPAGARCITCKSSVSRSVRLIAVPALPGRGIRPLRGGADLVGDKNSSAVGFRATELAADVAGVAFSLAALWLALSRPEWFPSWPVLAGAASGLAYGYKPLHLVGAVLVGLLIVFGRAPLVQTRPSAATRVWQSATFASAFLTLAGILLLRNQVQLGSPPRRTGPTMR